MDQEQSVTAARQVYADMRAAFLAVLDPHMSEQERIDLTSKNVDNALAEMDHDGTSTLMDMVALVQQERHHRERMATCTCAQETK